MWLLFESPPWGSIYLMMMTMIMIIMMVMMMMMILIIMMIMMMMGLIPLSNSKACSKLNIAGAS